ncbi:endolytic transglycosylase MltG [bacterium]|nr:endolytic transglycosylase MltG [bacterium]
MRLFKFILILLAVAGVVAYLNYRSAIEPISSIAKEVGFTIDKGENVDTISGNLAEKGLIKSAFWFRVYIKQKGQQSALQAGQYALSSSLSVPEIVDYLINGRSLSRERAVRIIEGWDIDDIDDYFLENNIVTGNKFINIAKGDMHIWPFTFLAPAWFEKIPPKATFEGYLFPDTYRVFKDASVEDILQKVLENFELKVTPKMIIDLEKQGKTLHEIITMASIVEREVFKESDRAIVAGILYKRLNIGMRLEVDSTINYITGKNDPAAEYKDLEIDSPYNTYKYYGLPPGPICNPGFSAIKAAIYPETSEYLFYLNRQDTKETIFSKTYIEHLSNKNKYLK